MKRLPILFFASSLAFLAYCSFAPLGFRPARAQAETTPAPLVLFHDASAPLHLSAAETPDGSPLALGPAPFDAFQLRRLHPGSRFARLHALTDSAGGGA